MNEQQTLGNALSKIVCFPHTAYGWLNTYTFSPESLERTSLIEERMRKHQFVHYGKINPLVFHDYSSRCIDTCANIRSKLIECHLYILTRSHSLAAFPQKRKKERKNCQLLFTSLSLSLSICIHCMHELVRSYRGRERASARLPI